MKLRKTL
jgi:hypothetical protein